MVVGSEAWITSAVEEKHVEKAITLAASLRRVRTAKKLVVLTTLRVSEESRKKLKETFDLVLPLDSLTQNGWSLEDYAKIHAFSLDIFNKCVYLSPNTLVLKNCDNIFGKNVDFAAGKIGENKDIDSSVFLFSPSFFRPFAQKVIADHVGDSSKNFNLWLRNQIPNIEILDEKYNLRLELKGDVGFQQSLNSLADVSIVNFIDIHPLDMDVDVDEEIMWKTWRQIGVVEKFAVDYCWEIYTDAVKKRGLISPQIAFNNEYKTEPIAIVGMSFRLPGGNNPEEFWSLLEEGKSAIVPVPLNRWTKEHSYYPCKDRKMEGGFLDLPIDQFDWKFFGLSPKEAEMLDPQQRLLLEVTWEAFEDAMINPLSLRGSKMGVFVGSWIQHYKTICSQSVDGDFFRTYMGNSIASTAARLSHFFETTGPSIATESACSSTIAALHMACKNLRGMDSDIAVAAGVNLILHPSEEGKLEQVLSPDFRCKTFDAEANGFARAEGCVSFVLKRLSDAIRDDNKIWGLIRGTALTQEGPSKSMGTPTVECESMAMELALQDGGIEPKDVSYVEAHGTGTAVGDPLEILSIQKVYSKGRSEPLVIGSVKTNIGHTESVSGLTGIIKVLLSMKNERIPKHLNLKTLNPQINLEAIPARIPLEALPWPKDDKKGRRIAGVSSFGISGTDGHAIIEEPFDIPQPPRQEFGQERPLHVMKLSAKSSESLDELVQEYQQKMSKNEGSEKDFANIAYSANVGRATFNHRAVIIARNLEDAEKILEARSFKQADVQSATKSLCFLFTGQGSQYAGMGKLLYQTSPVFKDSFDKCDQFLRRRYNIYIKNVLWSNDGKSEELNRTLYSQTSIFVVEYCLLKLWESWGIKPDYVMGHSLGEFAAAVAAGALKFEDALMLVAERSRLIDSLPRGKMLVIKADKKTVDEAIIAFRKINPDFWVDYAALNSPDQTVVAGDAAMIEEFQEFCKQKSLKTIILAATHAFHSRHMEPMLDAYRRVASTVKKPEVKEGSPKFISGMEGKLVEVDGIDSDYWVRHTREKVSFMDACKVIQEEGCTLFLEVGPHPVLSALTILNMERAGDQVKCLPSIRKKEEEWVTMLDTLSTLYLSGWKGEIDWKGFDRFYSREKVKLPFYQFNRKPIWATFEGIASSIHPLLGSLVPCALGDTIYQSSLTAKKPNYIQDHVIGNTVLFPGAGFLEMCLAAGHSTVQGFTEDFKRPTHPILLKSLKIESALALVESRIYRLQTVVTVNDREGESELGYSIQVHHQQNTKDVNGVGGHRWVLHASAKFLPVVRNQLKQILEPIDISHIRSSWEEEDVSEFYEKLPEVGLRFGPQFRSLESSWRSKKGLLTSIKVPENYCDYLIHPVVADALFQTLMLWGNKEKSMKKLHVPVQIGEFIWLKEASNSSKTVYAYASTSSMTSGVCCTLLDEDGAPLALMKNVDFIETTAKIMEGMITQQSTKMPMLWEEAWKESPGPMQGYLKHETPEQPYSDEDLNYFAERNKLSPEEYNHYLNVVNMTRLSILKALYTLGWKPQVGQVFTVDFLMTTLKIKENFRQYIHFFMRNFTLKQYDSGWLETLDHKEETTFKIVRSLPKIEEIEEGLKHVTSPDDVFREDYRIVKEIENNLAKILSGEVDPLAILFPDKDGINNDASRPSAQKAYDLYSSTLYSPRHFRKVDMHMLKSIPAIPQSPHNNLQKSSTAYRCLEVGGGTGAYTQAFLKHVMSNKDWKKIQIEYYFTDVSPAFFTPAEKMLKDQAKNINIIFKKFDMEKDPLEQGFCPGYFDMIFASEVFHIAKDLKKTMRNVRSLLKSGGLLYFLETVRPCERNTFIFGLLDGFWRFEDKELRKNHVSLSSELWEQVLLDSGFRGFTVVPMYNNVSGVMTSYAAPLENDFLKDLYPAKNFWIIFGEHDEWTRTISQKLSNVNRKCLIVPKPKENEFKETTIVEYFRESLTIALEGMEERVLEGVLYLWSLCPNTKDQASVSLPFLTLMKLIGEMKMTPRVFSVMKGALAIESHDVVDPTPGTLAGLSRSVMNEHHGLNVICLDLDPMKDLRDQNEELFMNLWVDHTISTAFRDGLRLRPRMVKGKFSNNEPLSLPTGCDRFQLVLPKTKLISDLEFAYLEPYTLKENEVEIEVKAIGLNFRDVFAVLKPTVRFENASVGNFDCGGVVVRTGRNVTKFKVGDRVMGFTVSNRISLPSHIKCPDYQIIPFPKTWSFAEGVTLPTAFSTVYYCLVILGKMKKGETVLIHTASGGVGLAAIQLCKHIGANIIATAGSSRKMTYLKNLGIQHVFHSRTLDFKQKILEVTEGRGVDIILNSLTGPGFKEASLDVLCKNGRFIEMSQINVWTTEEVKLLRPDVYYELFNLLELEMEEYKKINHELENFLKSGIVKPIAYEQFDALNIRAALNYLQNAKHIGKIVCITPEVKLEKSKFITTTPLFNELSTYVVTGGLGGIGFEVVKWYLRNGAKHVVILSRSSPTKEIATEIEKLNRAGNHVQAFPVSVGDFEKLKSVFEDFPNHGFPQLRGVMHVAGVLKDGSLEAQSWDSFRHCYKPKVDGSWNLHELTKNELLEHFVVFSSMAALIGSPVQANHCASNSFEDSLAAYRRSIGLPGTSINWGVWGEVGVATETDFPGIRLMSTSQCLLVLETCLRTQTNQIGPNNVESFAQLSKLFPLVKTYVDDTVLLMDSAQNKSSTMLNYDEFWNEVDSASNRDGKIDSFKNLIKPIVRGILKMGVDERIDDLMEFQLLGIDSLMLLELKNCLQNILGSRITITVSQLKDCNNVEMLANHLVNLLDGKSDDDDEGSIPSHEELVRLIREDSNLLPDSYSVEGLRKVEISDVETVLLTGVTGNLGPYLLNELTKNSQIKKVYCLIRPFGKLSCEQRLISRLEQINIIDSVDMSKVEVIEGDLSAPKFGLTEKLYGNLCESVDAIVHNAVKADHTANYWKSPESRKNDVRTVNVIGTLRALEFAGEKKVKHCFYSSTLLTWNGRGKPGESEADGWQDVGAFDSFQSSVGHGGGYVISKHISEQLVYNAIKKGIPCKAFRFPVITGESKTGRVDYQRNHILLRWMACMKMGAIYDFPVPLVMFPVDHCAKISLDIFFNPDAPNDVYNVVQKEVALEQVLIQVAREFGIEIKTVSYPEFVNLLKADENSPLAPFIKLYEEDVESAFMMNFKKMRMNSVEKCFENGEYESVVGPSKLIEYAPDYESIAERANQTLIRDLNFLRNEGAFQKFGINIAY